MRANRLVLLVVVSVVAASVAMFAADPNIGTWKLNIAKSKFADASMAPKSAQTKIEAAAGGGVTVTVDNVGADGKPVHYSYTAKYDGKDYPVKGDPNRDSIAITKKDDYNYTVVSKLAGKVTSTASVAYSKDGKTRTVTVSGTNAQGQSGTNVQVYDKQ
jgi:hypothetical protein